MLLKNHIASRFLDKKDDLVMEILEHTHPDEFKKSLDMADKSDRGDLPKELTDTYALLVNKDNKNYIVTHSVLGLLDMLKVSKDGKNYDWSVFNNIKEGKYTFILPDNKLLRVFVQLNTIWFFHLEETKETSTTSHLGWVMFYFDRHTGEPCEHYSHIDVKTLEPFVYSLLCFIFLTKNDEIELKPGQKVGTKKSGKVINSLQQNITIINSRWNTTVITKGSFGVCGHFRLQPTGIGRMETTLIFIEPFVKSGITRKAKALDHIK